MLDPPNCGVSQLVGESAIHDEHGARGDVVVHPWEVLDLVDRAGELAEVEFTTYLAQQRRVDHFKIYNVNFYIFTVYKLCIYTRLY